MRCTCGTHQRTHHIPAPSSCDTLQGGFHPCARKARTHSRVSAVPLVCVPCVSLVGNRMRACIVCLGFRPRQVARREALQAEEEAAKLKAEEDTRREAEYAKKLALLAQQAKRKRKRDRYFWDSSPCVKRCTEWERGACRCWC